MRAFHRSLALPYDQMLVVEGDLARMRRTLLDGVAVPAQPQAERPAAAELEPEGRYPAIMARNAQFLELARAWEKALTHE